MDMGETFNYKGTIAENRGSAIVYSSDTESDTNSNNSTGVELDLAMNTGSLIIKYVVFLSTNHYPIIKRDNNQLSRDIF